MIDAAQFADQVRQAVDGHPYAVVDQTADGFTLQLDVVDTRWWSVFRRNALRRVWRWDVRVTGPDTYTVTDRVGELAWDAGVGVGDGLPRPRLRFTAGFFAGTAVSVGKRRIWAIADDGRFGKVVDYAFDSREGRDAIDAVARRLGLTKKMNTPAKIGLFTAVFAAGGTALGGLWALVRSFL